MMLRACLREGTSKKPLHRLFVARHGQLQQERQLSDQPQRGQPSYCRGKGTKRSRRKSDGSRMTQHAPFSTSSSEPASPAEAATADAVESFTKLVYTRHAAYGFDSEVPIPQRVVADLLRLTQRAPSSFNSQPWSVVLVQDAERREALAAAMLGANARKVLEAPLVAVFCADLQPSKRFPRILELAKANGASDRQLSTMDMALGLFGGEGRLAGALKQAATSLLSPLRPSPSVCNTEAWSNKPTCMAAQTYMLAATAHGLATCPMEGFDGRRVRHALDVPCRYAVPVVIATGYPVQAEWERRRFGGGENAMWRLPPEEVGFSDRFGQPLRTTD